MDHKFYFVGSNGESPDQIYFTLEDAQTDLHQFIDIFDCRGHLVTGIEQNRNATHPKINLEKLK